MFQIGRSQTYNYAHAMSRLQVIKGVRYSAVVLSAVRDLKERPVMLKVPVTPKLADLIANDTLISTDTVVPNEHNDLYTE